MNGRSFKEVRPVTSFASQRSTLNFTSNQGNTSQKIPLYSSQSLKRRQLQSASSLVENQKEQHSPKKSFFINTKQENITSNLFSKEDINSPNSSIFPKSAKSISELYHTSCKSSHFSTMSNKLLLSKFESSNINQKSLLERQAEIMKEGSTQKIRPINLMQRIGKTCAGKFCKFILKDDENLQTRAEEVDNIMFKIISARQENDFKSELQYRLSIALDYFVSLKKQIKKPIPEFLLPYKYIILCKHYFDNNKQSQVFDKDFNIVKQMEQVTKNPNFLYETVKVCEGCYKIYDIVRNLYQRQKHEDKLSKQSDLQEKKQRLQECEVLSLTPTSKNAIQQKINKTEKNGLKEQFCRDSEQQKNTSPSENFSNEKSFSRLATQVSKLTIQHPNFSSPNYNSSGFYSPNYKSSGFTSLGLISPVFNSSGQNTPGYSTPKHNSQISDFKSEGKSSFAKQRQIMKQKIMEQRYMKTSIGQIDKNSIDDLLLDMHVRMQEIDLSLQWQSKPQVAKEEIKKINQMVINERISKQQKEYEKEMQQIKQKNKLESLLNNQLVPQEEFHEKPYHIQILSSPEQRIPKNLVYNPYLSKQEFNDRLQYLRIQKYGQRKKSDKSQK